MAAIISCSSEFHHALETNRAHVAPLDAQALQSGLFDRNDEVRFFRPAVMTSRPPSDSIDIVALRDFDEVWGSDLLRQRLSR
jgi:hypothetical protein